MIEPITSARATSDHFAPPRRPRTRTTPTATRPIPEAWTIEVGTLRNRTATSSTMTGAAPRAMGYVRLISARSYAVVSSQK